MIYEGGEVQRTERLLQQILKALGLGIALAVLIDSTLIWIFFVPATMHLMGRWNWWMPDWVRRLNPFTASQ